MRKVITSIENGDPKIRTRITAHSETEHSVEYTSTAACQDAGITYHLTPVEVWDAQRLAETYVPEAFDIDGFIHCTNGLELLGAVANHFYREDRRAFTVLVLNMSTLSSPVRYDELPERFPHIYGPINPDAVVGELPVRRAENGAFTQLGSTDVSDDIL